MLRRRRRDGRRAAQCRRIVVACRKRCTKPHAAPLVLLGARVSESFRDRLAARYEVLGPLAPPFPETVAAMPRPDAERVGALITMGSVRTTRAAIATLPALGLISCMGSGYEGVDLEAARERAIAVTHSPAANASAVADVAMGLLIASVRRMFDANAFLRRGDWKGNAAKRMAFANGLTGRKVGIYGLGAIGEKIARRAVAFEMDVAYHNRKRRDDVDYRVLPDIARARCAGPTCSSSPCAPTPAITMRSTPACSPHSAPTGTS